MDFINASGSSFTEAQFKSLVREFVKSVNILPWIWSKDEGMTFINLPAEMGTGQYWIILLDDRYWYRGRRVSHLQEGYWKTMQQIEYIPINIIVSTVTPLNCRQDFLRVDVHGSLHGLPVWGRTCKCGVLEVWHLSLQPQGKGEGSH